MDDPLDPVAAVAQSDCLAQQAEPPTLPAEGLAAGRGQSPDGEPNHRETPAANDLENDAAEAPPANSEHPEPTSPASVTVASPPPVRALHSPAEPIPPTLPAPPNDLAGGPPTAEVVALRDALQRTSIGQLQLQQTLTHLAGEMTALGETLGSVAQPRFLVPRRRRPGSFTLFAVALLLLSWSFVLWIRTGDLRIGVLGLLLTNVVVCGLGREASRRFDAVSAGSA